MQVLAIFIWVYGTTSLRAPYTFSPVIVANEMECQIF